MRYGRLLFVALVITGCSGDGLSARSKSGLAPTEPMPVPRSLPAPADTITRRTQLPVTP